MCSVALTMLDETVLICGLDWHQDSVNEVCVHRVHRWCCVLVSAAPACRLEDRSIVK
jgi:hypothetical protein